VAGRGAASLIGHGSGPGAVVGECGLAKNVGEADWVEALPVVRVSWWENAQEECDVAMERRSLVAALLVKTSPSSTFQWRCTAGKPLGRVELLIVNAQRSLW
jgi:hypothetical protein